MAENQPEQKKGEIQIQLDEQTAQGVYVNLAMITHTDAEFVIDLLYLQPQAPQAKVRARAITSPVHAKRLLRALQENVNKYESKFGVINEPQNVPSRPMGMA
ncbi:MAG: DUF3467 domain-containing protein [Elusimicrobiota bacterium]